MQATTSEIMWKEAIDRCRGFLLSHSVSPDLEHFLLAVSGGMDSMVMLTLLHSMHVKVQVAHMNYGLRGEASDGDALLVREYCGQLEVSYHERCVDLHALSEKEKEGTQVLARRLRYAWFEELSQELQCNWICTAHHQNDAVETFFINLLRGTGIKGLKGIPVIRGNILRPMLCFSHEEIEVLATEISIPYRTDVSNTGRDYLRNRLRLDILPHFVQERPDFVRRMKSTQLRLREEFALLEDYLEQLKSELCTTSGSQMHIDRVKLMQGKSPAVILLHVIREFGFSWTQCQNATEPDKISGTKYLSSTHQMILNNISFDVSRHNEAVAEYPEMSIFREGEFILPDGLLTIQHVVTLPEYNNDSCIEYIDGDKLEDKLVLRHWQDGDWFYPLGNAGRQKLQDYFTNTRVSMQRKKQTWILCSEEDIVWVVGMRLDNRYKVTSATTHYLHLKWIPSEA